MMLRLHRGELVKKQQRVEVVSFKAFKHNLCKTSFGFPIELEERGKATVRWVDMDEYL